MTSITLRMSDLRPWESIMNVNALRAKSRSIMEDLVRSLASITESKPVYLPIIASLWLATYLHPSAFLALGLLLYIGYRNDFTYQLPSVLALMIAAAPLTLFLALDATLPPDDGLRHAVAHRFGFDYNQIYLEMEWMPRQSMWIGYEWILGHLDSNFGLNGALQTMRLIMAATFIATVYSALRKILPRDDQQNAVFLLLVAALSLAIGRLYLARPEFIAMTWAISAFVLPWRVWVFIGLCIQPGYYFAFLYIPAIVLLDTSWRNRMVAGLTVLVGSAIFWLSYAGMDWLAFIQASFTWLSRREGVQVLENLSVTRYLDAYTGLAAAVCVIIGFGRDWSRYVGLLAFSTFFLLPNQARYIPTLAVPLIFIVAMILGEHGKAKFSFAFTTICAVFFTHITGSMIFDYANASSMPDFKLLPPHVKVLAMPDQSMYWLVATRNSDVKIAPAMEFGVNRKETKLLSKQLQGAEPVDCEMLTRSQYGYAISSRLYRPAPCLKYLETSKAWQLWQVTRP